MVESIFILFLLVCELVDFFGCCPVAFLSTMGAVGPSKSKLEMWLNLEMTGYLYMIYLCLVYESFKTAVTNFLALRDH